MPARKLAQLLDDTPALRAIAEASRNNERLQRVFLEAVPAELSRTCRIGGARAGILFIAAANGAAASKLRQLAPRILDHFRRQGLEFNAMRIEVQVAAARPTEPAKRVKPLSEKALRSIQLAREQVSDSPLKAALARLGRRR